MATYITNQLFSDFRKCKYMAYLRLAGKTGCCSEFEGLVRRLSQDYHSDVVGHLLQHCTANDITTQPLSLTDLMRNKYSLAIDVTHSNDDITLHFDALMAFESSPNIRTAIYIPVLFGYEEKISKDQKSLLAFCASVLAVQQGFEPPFGRIIHGSRFTSSKIRLGKLLGEADLIVQQIRDLKQADDPPPLHLNSHCPRCEFSQNCRSVVVEKDDLSLLQNIKEKEIANLNSRGIFTVTQLSYTFRARKRSIRSKSKKVKYYHSIRARAIRENRIYVVGRPELRLSDTSVFLDVEGIPDQDFYYLVGLRICSRRSTIEHSFWADDRAGEEKMWNDFLYVITTLNDPRLLHYGKYETTFFKNMKKRYGYTCHDGAVLEKILAEAKNVLSVIYGQIYFPTYSNGLKDIASFLGHTWSMKNPSGLRSLLYRYKWETTGDSKIKDSLITYNAEDCEALEKVVKTILQLTHGESPSPTTLAPTHAVHIDSLKPESLYSFGPLDFALPQFNHINKCAYWDYQRDRIYIRSNERLRRVARRRQRQKKTASSRRVNKKVGPSWPWKCPECGSSKIAKRGKHSKLLYDLRFSPSGVKRWIIKYVVVHYICNNCGCRFPSDERKWSRHRYGQQLIAYVIYNIIELNIPQLKLAQSMNRLFGYSVNQSTINRLKIRATEFYSETLQKIKEDILAGNLIHADETKICTKFKTGYVWVFTSMEEVVYMWAETREGDLVRQFLSGFSGVLVSDFYAAYDSIECPQQKCLIHFIRDLNSYLLREPFNEELKTLGHEFADLLKRIIETVDHSGLRKQFLKKHQKDVTRFYETLLQRNYETELASKVQERFKKNQDKLFTFLEHDGIPWNNNNAEHAIKAFARLRDVIQYFTNERGIQDY